MKEVYRLHIGKPIACHEQDRWKFAEKGGNYKAKMKWKFFFALQILLSFHWYNKTHHLLELEEKGL